MSKIFEALTRAQDTEIPMGRLLEGQAPEPEQPAAAARPGTAPPAPPPDQPVAVARPGTAPLAPPPDGRALAGIRRIPLRVAPTAPILPFDGSHAYAGEEYRILRTKIVQHAKQPQIIVVTSAGPNDGKSVTAINLAGAMALKSEARVLLLDGDFRRSTIAKQIGISNTPGLCDILKGSCSLAEAAIQTQQIKNLYVIPAGEALANPVELLDSHFADFCASCRVHFKYIIVDSPPVGLVADYDLIQAACDGIVIVVRPDYTKREPCMEALRGVSKAKFLGVVLNCAPDWFLNPHRPKDRSYYSSYYRHPEHTPSTSLLPAGASPRPSRDSGMRNSRPGAASNGPS